MDYFTTINVIMTVLFSLLGVLTAHFVVFAIVGVFRKKSVPRTDKINRFGLIIPARNEEEVVAGLIESIKKNDYPQDMLQVFVIAHNCSDRTAEIAREHGATVYEYKAPG